MLKYIFLSWILLMVGNDTASALQKNVTYDTFPEKRQDEKDLFPNPLDNHIAEINPPGFAWLPVKNASKYKVVFNDAATGIQKYVFFVENRNVLSPQELLYPGKYKWTIEAYDNNGNMIARRRPYTLIIPKDLPELPFPRIDELISTISKDHPRLIFTKDNVDEIRASLSTSRKQGWKATKKMADKSLDLSLPEPPHYGTIEEYNLRRIEYRKYYRYLRPFIDEGLQSLSLAWLMTGEEKYATSAKQILLEVCKWDAKGITSSNQIGFDEPGLSLARCMHLAYDWLYDALTEEERTIVKQSCIERARDTFRRVAINRPFLKNPGNSHDGRLIGYLCEQALVLYGEATNEEVKQWFEYSLLAFMTVFPHWGGQDGGWAEGIGYAATYNNKATHWIESCYSTLNLNLWQKPFFQKVKDYFLYCARPNDEYWPFGDGAERGPGNQTSRAKILHVLMSHYAQRFQDPACQWWAEQVSIERTEIEHPGVPIILPLKTKAVKPTDIPNAKVFTGVGWCAMHSDISDIDNDVFFLLKSSPYGSISHSHADQNAFYISVGGRALAIPSGYYGPVYGMPHHAKWTRATKANNCVLVNGQGQTIRDFTANGQIIDFKHGEQISYVVADAAPAYKELLDRCLRYVIFVRPGLFIILDDLHAPEKSTFQWLLHTLVGMDLDESRQTIRCKRKGAWLNVRLFNSSKSPMSFFQTDQFDTPYFEGIPEDRQKVLSNTRYDTFIKDEPLQYHFTASTIKSQKHIRIVTILTAGSGDYEPEINWLETKGWKGARIKTLKGIAEVWGQLSEGAELKKASISNMRSNFSDSVVIVGLWKPNNDEPIEVLFGKQVFSQD